MVPISENYIKRNNLVCLIILYFLTNQIKVSEHYHIKGLHSTQ